MALGVLQALGPISAARADIKDATVLILRKSMFARDVKNRLLAVRGFLYTILCELLQCGQSSAYSSAPSSSQVSDKSPVRGADSMNVQTAASNGSIGSPVVCNQHHLLW